jgi:hypothetical protein
MNDRSNNFEKYLREPTHTGGHFDRITMSHVTQLPAVVNSRVRDLYTEGNKEAACVFVVRVQVRFSLRLVPVLPQIASSEVRMVRFLSIKSCAISLYDFDLTLTSLVIARTIWT